MMWTLLLTLAGCGPDPSCDQMCASARSLYGECLADWGTDWTAAGYADGQDFEDSCQTWAWEMRHLERDARRRGQAERGDVDRACARRQRRLSSADATCDDITQIDWSETPWAH